MMSDVSNYTKIENEVLEKLYSVNLSGSALACALVLLRKTNGYHKTADGISLTQFQKEINRTKPTIIKALKELKLVKICLLVKSGKSSKSISVYAFNKNLDEWKLVKKPLLVKKRKSTGKESYSKLVKKSSHTKETITKETIQKKEHDRFDEFWKLYPNKKGKAKAIISYKKHLKIQEQIIEGLQRYIQYWKANKTEMQFIPHPSTWLNQKRWEDELDISKKLHSYARPPDLPADWTPEPVKPADPEVMRMAKEKLNLIKNNFSVKTL